MSINSELRARIGADSSGYRREMGNVARIATGTAAGIAASFASVFTARTFAGQISALAQYGDALDKAAKRTSMATGDIERLTLAAQLSGAEIGDVEKSIFRMADTIVDAGNGLAEGKRSLDALGVSLKDLDGLTPAQQFAVLMEALAGVTNSTQRMALVQDIFGRSGKNLLPMLSDGAAGFRALMEEQDKFGTASERSVKASADFIDAMQRLKTAFAGVRAEVGTEALDSMAKTIDDLALKMGNLRKSGDLARYGDELKKAVEGAYNALMGLASFIAKNKDILATLGLSYAGIRILQSLTTTVTVMGHAFAGVVGTITAHTVATTANTAATTANTAAHAAQLVALQSSTIGITQATAATSAYAAQLAATSAAGMTLAGTLGTLAAAGATAFAGWTVGKKIGEATGITEGVGNLLGDAISPYVQDARDEETRVWLAKKLRERESRPKPKPTEQTAPAVAPDPDETAKALAEAERQSAQFQAAEKRIAALQQKAIVAIRTGDTKTMELWDALTGGADPNAAMTAIQRVGIMDALDAIVPGNVEAGYEVLTARVNARADAAKAAADAATAAADREREEVRRMLRERQRLAEELDRLSAPDPASERLDAKAQRLKDASARLMQRSEEAFTRARKPRNEQRREAREARAQARETAREEQRIDRARDLMRHGRWVGQRDQELVQADKLRRQAQAAAGGVRTAQQQATAARMREATEPLRVELRSIDQILRQRLPEGRA